MGGVGIHFNHVHRGAGLQVFQAPAKVGQVDAVHGGTHADDGRQEVDFLIGVFLLQAVH